MEEGGMEEGGMEEGGMEEGMEEGMEGARDLAMAMQARPFTVSRPASLRMTSLGEVQPLIFPVSLTPHTRGQVMKNGPPAMATDTSMPPAPMASIPIPPPVGVWLSAPSSSSPCRCRLTGLEPMAQPPGSETTAWPSRASSGPSTRMEARILRTMSR